MKVSKILLAAVIVIMFTINASAQWATNGNDIHNTNSGNVGIGTSSPAKPLTLYNSDATLRIEDADGQGVSIIRDAYNATWNTMQISKYNATGHSQISIDPSPGDHVSQAIFRFFRTTNTTGNVGFYIHKGDGTNAENSVLRGNGNTFLNALTGNVSIGTTDAQGYKLAVSGNVAIDGNLKAKEVEVKLDVWADYVFKEGYILRPLSEVETFIKENKHLPGIPSEEEVQKEGINVGEMNTLLLEKIEELTLYMIDLKKENEEIKSQIENLRGE